MNRPVGKCVTEEEPIRLQPPAAREEVGDGEKATFKLKEGKCRFIDEPCCEMLVGPVFVRNFLVIFCINFSLQ